MYVLMSSDPFTMGSKRIHRKVTKQVISVIWVNIYFKSYYECFLGSV
jgi:hypothetical protein